MRVLIAAAVGALLFWPSPLARADESIPPTVLRAIKRATVFVKVKGEGEEFSGSGFVVKTEGDVAYVITNHHVIEPKVIDIVAQWRRDPRPSTPRYHGRYGTRGFYVPPGNSSLELVPRIVVRSLKNINATVVFGSGTSSEQSLKAEVLAADQDIDLAILKVDGVKNPPRPIDCRQDAEITETMPIYIFGFPLGSELATNNGNPAMTVGKASVSSLRLDDAGELTYVQIDGALNHGNSGGPVVDARGHLVGVAVAIMRDGNNIGLAIPGKKVPSMWEGHLGAPQFALHKEADGLKLDATVDLIDPFHNIKSAELWLLTGDQAAQKPKAGEQLKKLMGSHKLALSIDGAKAAGHLAMKDTVSQIRVLFQGESVDRKGLHRFTASGDQTVRAQAAALPNSQLAGAANGQSPGVNGFVSGYSPPKYNSADPMASPADFTAVVEDLTSGDFSRRIQAEMRLIRAAASDPHPEVAKALEQTLAADNDAVVRSQAAWALEKWGTTGSVAALEKAAQNDASPAVRARATVTIDAIKNRQ